MAKKLLAVKMRKGENLKRDGHVLCRFHMAWVSTPDLERYQASGLVTCREHFCNIVYGFINNENTTGYSVIDDAPIDLDRTRLLIVNEGKSGYWEEPSYTKEQFRTGLFNGKALLNVYEKLGNFSCTSKISTINHEKYGKQWLITGPQEWIKSGQLVSAMTFLLRLATYFEEIDTTDINTVENSFKMLLADKKFRKVKSDIDTVLRLFWDKLWVLVKFQNDLFSTDIESNYKVKDMLCHDYGIACGINNLAKAESNLPGNVDEKFKILCKEHLPRKKVEMEETN